MNPAEAIVTAVRNRDAEAVRRLLAADPGLASLKTDDGSLVLTAVYYGAKGALEAILACKPELDVFAATAVGDVDRLRSLLTADPALLHPSTAEGYTLLGLAAFFGQTEAARALLELGADVNALSQSKVSYVPSNTALHAATAGGRHADLVALLLEKGADPNALDSLGGTPLHNAAFNGDMAAGRLLLEAGARTDIRRHSGETALAIAESRGHAEFAALLREHGAQE